MKMNARDILALGASGLLVISNNAQAQEETILAPIIVEAKDSISDDEDSILAKSTTSATKTGTAILETAKSVSVVTREQLDQQSPRTTSEALRYTAGVLSDRDSNTRYDAMFIRGFGGFGTSTNFVNFLDGLKLPRGQAFAQSSIDPYFLERLDVLKGPSAVLYGQTSPGGIVNQTSRQPAAEPFNEVRIEAGTHGRIKSGLTSRGALTKDGNVQYSLSAVGMRSGTRYDNVEEERFGIAPALTWQPTDDTKLTISTYYQKDPEGGYNNSLYPRSLAPAAYRPYLNRDLNIGDPNFEGYEREQFGIGYVFEHRFNDLAEIRSKFRYTDVNSDLHGIQMAGAIDAGGNIARNAVRSIEGVNGISTDNQAKFNFDTGAISHTALAGFDFQNSKSNWEYKFAAAPALNVVNPQYGQAIGPLTTAVNNGQELTQTGIYLQDQLSFGGLRANLGIRHDWTRQKMNNRVANTSSSQSSNATSYQAGLLYLFDNGFAPYASYSTSFEPVIGVDANGKAFKPTEAKQIEAGIKYEPGFMDALITLSAFDIRQQNVLTPGPVPGFNIQTGEIHSRGLEFEMRGNITSNLEVIAALTLLDTEVSKSTTATTVGKKPQGVPGYFASIWANYAFDTGVLKGASVGAGVRMVGSSYADDANTIKADGYSLVDAALRYDFEAINDDLKGLQATLNVTNLFDEDYYSSCSYNTYCQFGDGRQVKAGLRYQW